MLSFSSPLFASVSLCSALLSPRFLWTNRISPKVIFIIAQKPPPTFKNEKEWSPEFLDFTSKCLQKDPAARPTAKDLLDVCSLLPVSTSADQHQPAQHPFIKRGMQNKEIVTKLVSETLPLLEKYRREKAARGPEVRSSSAALCYPMILLPCPPACVPFTNKPCSPGANGHIRGFGHNRAGNGYR